MQFFAIFPGTKVLCYYEEAPRVFPYIAESVHGCCTPSTAQIVPQQKGADYSYRGIVYPPRSCGLVLKLTRFDFENHY